MTEIEKFLLDGAFHWLFPAQVPSGGDWALHRGGAVFLPNTRHGWCLMLVLALTLLGCIFKEDFAHGPALLAHGMHHGADAAALKGTCAAPPPQLPFRLQVSCR